MKPQRSTYQPQRHTYRITKAGEPELMGYLFDDNRKYWLDRGYTLTMIS